MILFWLSASAALAIEMQLAGLRLGRPAQTVIDKYGNPSDIRIGATAQVTQLSGVGAPGFGATSGGPMMSGAPVGAIPGIGSSGLYGVGSPMEVSPFASQGLPGMGMPGTSAGTVQQTSERTGPPEVTWIYRLPKNRTLEVLINPDGKIVQIAIYGVSWAGTRTSTGIELGNTYKDVLTKCGFPETHEQSGIQLIVKYPRKYGAVFTLVGNTVAGITIALMD
jgi:hypothetical protein